MIINISKNITVSLIFNRLMDEGNFPRLTAPIESIFFSKEMYAKAQDSGVIEKNSSTPKHRLQKELLALDPIYFAYDLLNTYLDLNYVGVSLEYNEEKKRVEIPSFPYQGTFIENLLNDLNDSIENIISDKQNAFNNLAFNPLFYIKVLLFVDEDFRDITTQLNLAERLLYDFYFLEQAQVEIKEFPDVPLEEVLTEQSFDELVRKAERIVDRLNELAPYRDELEEDLHLQLDSVLFRPFIVSATDEEFEALLKSLIARRKKIHLPDKVKIPKELTTSKAFSLHPDREPDLYTIHQDKNFKYQAKIICMDSEGKYVGLSPSHFSYIWACNTLFEENQNRRGTFSFLDLWLALGNTGHPKEEELIKLQKELLFLSSTVCYRVMVISGTDLDKTHELNPDKKEELTFFETCTGYNFTPLVKHWAMNIDHVIPAGNFNFSGNRNGTESATFELYNQPIMFRAAEEMKQIFSVPFEAMKIGNRFKGELGHAIFYRINKEISWLECRSWTRNYERFFGKDGLGYTKQELKDPETKRRILDTLQNVLYHLSPHPEDGEDVRPRIQGFNIERMTGNFYFIPQPIVGESPDDPERLEKVKAFNKTLNVNSVKGQFKKMIKRSGGMNISQRYYPDDKDHKGQDKFKLKVENEKPLKSHGKGGVKGAKGKLT